MDLFSSHFVSFSFDQSLFSFICVLCGEILRTLYFRVNKEKMY